MGTIASLDTKELLLNVAEQTIAGHGFASATLRSIVSQAGVNLASVRYHFGSKEELFRAVVSRIARPIVEQQLACLAHIQTQADSRLSVQAILTAFLIPPLELIVQDERLRVTRAQFIGRCRTEPEPIQSIASQEFGASVEAFLDALQRALPQQSRSQLQWKLDLVITILIRVLAEAAKPGALLQSNTPVDIEKTISKLLAFVIPGMECP